MCIILCKDDTDVNDPIGNMAAEAALAMSRKPSSVVGSTTSPCRHGTCSTLSICSSSLMSSELGLCVPSRPGPNFKLCSDAVG